MSIYADIREWDKAYADYLSDDGDNSAVRMLRRIKAAERLGEIEGRWERVPGGFSGERARAEERVKRVVDGMPPLTDEQLVKLTLLLQG